VKMGMRQCLIPFCPATKKREIGGRDFYTKI